ncbi:hypothetical protein FI667_g11252, partial [Globisporangium splendens]
MAEGDDDDAVLQATLAFMDEYDAGAAAEELRGGQQQQQRQLGDRSHREDGLTLSLETRLSEELRAVDGVLVDEHTLHSLISDEDAPPSDTGCQPSFTSPLRQGGYNDETAMQAGDEPKKNKKPGNPNKARDERRDEILYLRKKVSELEIQLDSVKRKRPRIESGIVEQSHSAPSPPSLQQESAIVEHQRQAVHPAVVEVWKAIANRQSDARTQAERENIRLKLVLEQQIKLAKSLEKLLRNKSSTKDAEKCVPDRRLYGLYTSMATEQSDAEIFDDLISGLDQSYAQVDSVFQGNGLASRETELSDARMRFDASSGMCLEIFANKVLPFGMHAVANAAWQHFIFGKQRTPSRFYDYISSVPRADTTDDTIVENFNMELHAKNTSGYFRVKQVFRRYVEETRVVFVLRAVFFPVTVGDDRMTDVCFRDTGYIVVKRATKVPGDNFSLLQTSYNYTSLVGDDHPKVGVVTDFMLRATEANIVASHQMIENVLLLAHSQ